MNSKIPSRMISPSVSRQEPLMRPACFLLLRREEVSGRTMRPPRSVQGVTSAMQSARRKRLIPGGQQLTAITASCCTAKGSPDASSPSKI